MMLPTKFDVIIFTLDIGMGGWAQDVIGPFITAIINNDRPGKHSAYIYGPLLDIPVSLEYISYRFIIPRSGMASPVYRHDFKDGVIRPASMGAIIPGVEYYDVEDVWPELDEKWKSRIKKLPQYTS